MTDRTELVGVAIDAEDGPMIASGSLLARFLIRELESSDGISELLALFDGPQQCVARRLAARTTADGIREPSGHRTGRGPWHSRGARGALKSWG
jgi:hypothetical protein